VGRWRNQSETGWKQWTQWTLYYAVDILAVEWGVRGPGFESQRPDLHQHKTPAKMREEDSILFSPSYFKEIT
jgi:hypothetical protein